MSKIPLYNGTEEEKHTTRSVLAYVLDMTMRMLHPYMPYITEEIWQQLPHDGESITIASWPKVKGEFHDEESVRQMDRLVSIVRSVRNIRAEVDTQISLKVRLIITADDEDIVLSIHSY